MKDEEFKALYEDYKKSKFKQQKMTGWRPLPTISCITIIFVCFGVFFIIMGLIIIIIISQLPDPIDIIYTHDKEICPHNDNEKIYCIKQIKRKMKNPLMVYYQIDDLKQNSRSYLDNIDNVEIFDDNFTHWEFNGSDIYSNINFPQNYDEWTKKEKINPYSNVRKFWGSIEKDIRNGDIINITIELKENFKDKKKHLIIAQKSIFGGPRFFFLGGAYIVFGVLCLITSIIFINAYNKFHKKI